MSIPWLVLALVAYGTPQPLPYNQSQEGATISNASIARVLSLNWGSSGQTTFAGALSAALHGTHCETSYDTIMGLTGLAFRMRWFTPDSGRPYTGVAPVGEMDDPIKRAEQALGLKFDMASGDGGRLASTLTSAINKGQPVICYVAPHKDCAVLYGYRDFGRVFLVHDYYEDTASEQKLDSLDLFLIIQTVSPPTAGKDCLLQAIHAALSDRHRPTEPWGDGSFVYGADAFTAWRDVLEKVDRNASTMPLTHGTNWWIANSLADARLSASRYLLAAAPLLGSSTGTAHLRTAASLARQEADLFNNRKSGFTNTQGAAWTETDRHQEIKLITQWQSLDNRIERELQAAVRP